MKYMVNMYANGILCPRMCENKKEAKEVMVKNIFTFFCIRDAEAFCSSYPNTCEMVKELRLIVPDCYEFHVDDLMRNASGKIDSDDEFVIEVTNYDESLSKFVYPFIDDEEKMWDFYKLRKDEFLESYSYITEEEYDATYKEVYGEFANVDLDDYKEMLNASPEMVKAFVYRKYGLGWTLEWEVNLDYNTKVRSFVDNDNYYFKIKYVRNENNVFVPYRVISIEFLPERNF